MIIEITENEREYLERVCATAQLFATMYLDKKCHFEDDMESIRTLSVKFLQADANSIKLDDNLIADVT